ncbi:MAG: ABC transporter substrate-binding protein [Clostridiales bacterium]|nr:ABC transporter substrate-binding protein [Clostridiales bacterium]
MKKIPKFISVVVVMAICVAGGLAIGGCGNKTDEKVSIYCFGDYIDPILIRDFEKETGIKVVYSTFDTNEELYPVIKNNGADYDVICASDYMIEKLREEGHLDKLDKSEIPNLKNVLPEFMKKVEVFDPEQEYAVPHTWGTMGIMYNKKTLGKDVKIDSWSDLWQKKYKGRIVMPDSMRDTIGIGLKKNGYSLNTVDVHQLLAAQYDLIQQKPLVYKYVNDSARDLIIGGSADLAVVWNGEFLYSKAENKNVDFVVPKEGSEEFIDAWAVTAKGKNKKNANAWINFMLSKKAAIANFNYLTYTIPNKYVYDNMDQLVAELDEQAYNGKGVIKNNDVVFPSDEVLERCEILRNLGSDGDDLYTDIWKKFKAD